MWFIWLIGGLFIGSAIGFSTCAFFASRAFDRGYVDGYRNGKRSE